MEMMLAGYLNPQTAQEAKDVLAPGVAVWLPRDGQPRPWKRDADKPILTKAQDEDDGDADDDFDDDEDDDFDDELDDFDEDFDEYDDEDDEDEIENEDDDF
jgi:hypothetical protein